MMLGSLLRWTRRRTKAVLRSEAGPEAPACDPSRLGRRSAGDLAAAMADPTTAAAWQAAQQALKQFALPEMTGGVNPGDQRAIFHLVRWLRPSRMLEIGTHIGCSTVNISLALPTGSSLTTVDIRDVNCSRTRPWEEFQSKHAPAAMIQQIGAADRVRFVVSPSLPFLQQASADAGYDLIFLDGDHAEAVVLQELPAAMQCLRPGGLILLHDYFPAGLPLWAGQPALPGVWRAVEHHRQRRPQFNALPFGSLPWPTKLGSTISSLALVVGT